MRRLFTLLAAPLLLATIFAIPAHAFSVAIDNASFESITSQLSGLNPGQAVGSVEGWTKTGSAAGTMNPGAAHFDEDTPNGSNIAYIYEATLSQVLTETLQPETNYNLSVEVGWRNDMSIAGTYSISLYAGSTLLTQATSGTGNAPALIQGAFVPVVLTYSTGATVTSGALSIVLEAHGQTQMAFDDVQLEASNLTPEEPSAVPLPGAVSLLGLGMFGLAFVRSRR